MEYKSHKEAVEKIARELGRISGSKSLPKIFPGLQKEQFGYTIPKSSHITELLTKNKTKQQRFVVLQKIFGVHCSLNEALTKEIKPALNKLGFDYKDGAIMEFKVKQTKSLKNNVKITTRRYAKKSFLISDAMLRRGEKLAEAYLAIYLIENHLRLFIWKVLGKSNRKISKKLGQKEKRKINDRKKLERRNKWIPLRKDSNLFYLDIEDLSSIIQMNWSLFKTHFPDQHWITTKIQEVAIIRNRIAHNNSSITEIEKKTLELYVEQIFNQIK